MLYNVKVYNSLGIRESKFNLSRRETMMFLEEHGIHHWFSGPFNELNNGYRIVVEEKGHEVQGIM